MRLLAAVMLIGGIALAGFGLRIATRGRRPVDLAGAVLSPLGVLLAAAGLCGLAAPELLAGTAP